jgi:hypothetical protein
MTTLSDERTTDRYEEDISFRAGEEIGGHKGGWLDATREGEMGSGCLVLSAFGNERIWVERIKRSGKWNKGTGCLILQLLLYIGLDSQYDSQLLATAIVISTFFSCANHFHKFLMSINF